MPNWVIVSPRAFCTERENFHQPKGVESHQTGVGKLCCRVLGVFHNNTTVVAYIRNLGYKILPESGSSVNPPLVGAVRHDHGHDLQKECDCGHTVSRVQ